MTKTVRVLAAFLAVATMGAESKALTAATLLNGQTVVLSAPTGVGYFFKVTVPAGQGEFAVGTEGGTGECDLYIRYGAPPTLAAYDYRPFRAGNKEYVSVASPRAGDWYVLTYARSAFAGMKLGVAHVAAPAAAVTRVATPVFSPAGGAFAGSVRVTMTCVTVGATIRYTLNGTEPNATSAAYTAPITLLAGAVLRAKAFKPGLAESYSSAASFSVTAAAAAQTSLVRLETFSWVGGKRADPTGLPAGARYGEGVASGLRTCQWKWPSLILHACLPASATSATGTTVRWYHFTTNGQPHPTLGAYRWVNTHQAPEGGVIWYRWVPGK